MQNFRNFRNSSNFIFFSLRVHLSILLSFLLLDRAEADIRVGQTHNRVYVEGSSMDCRVPFREEIFIETAEKFANLLMSLQEQFRGTEWDELEIPKKEALRDALIAAMREFYANHVATEKLDPKTYYSDPSLPAPHHMADSDKVNWEQYLLPTAIFITVNKKIAGTREHSHDSAEAAVAEVAKDVTKDVARTIRNKIPPLSLAASGQIGLIAMPRCSWHMEKDPKKNEGHSVRGATKMIPGQIQSGLSSSLISNWDYSLLVMVHGRGGVGYEYATGESFLEKMKLTVGLIWGDLDSLDHLNGNFGAIGYNADFHFARLSAFLRDKFSWLKWGDKPIVTWNGDIGYNRKFGCIEIGAKSIADSIPSCEKLQFTTWRLESRKFPRGRDTLFRLRMNVKVDAGRVFTGNAAKAVFFGVQEAMTPEKLQELLSEPTYKAMIDDMRNNPPIALPINGSATDGAATDAAAPAAADNEILPVGNNTPSAAEVGASPPAPSN